MLKAEDFEEPMIIDDEPSTSKGSIAKGKSKKINTPWIEKYRPKVFTDIVGNEDTIARLNVFAENGNTPNLLICGPPGVGKTTTILCLARTLLGSSMKDAVLELNASNERGIDVVRNKIKMFAQKKVNLAPGKHKIIILDEADSMTDGAQQALRRTMEIYSTTTRFALACNNSDKIIEPIQSRCAVLRYEKLTDSQILTKLLQVCEIEKVQFTPEGLEAVIFTAQGDMRQALNNLQSTFNGFGYVDCNNVFKVCEEPHPLYLKNILDFCVKKNLSKSTQIYTLIWKMGYSAEDVINTMFRVCKNLDIGEDLKLRFIKEIGITHLGIVHGNNSFLQLHSLIARLCKCSPKK